MRLSAPNVQPWEKAETAAEVVEDDCGDGGAVHVEHRGMPRTTHTCEAWLSSPTGRGKRPGEGDDFDPHDTLGIRSMNLSRHGVGFESDQPVRPATFHRIIIGVGGGRIEAE
ncbi:MAG: hypothetical protein AAGK78_13695, partial [Planctomycetota bacterium]